MACQVFRRNIAAAIRQWAALERMRWPSPWETSSDPARLRRRFSCWRHDHGSGSLHPSLPSRRAFGMRRPGTALSFGYEGPQTRSPRLTNEGVISWTLRSFGHWPGVTFAARGFHRGMQLPAKRRRSSQSSLQRRARHASRDRRMQ